MFNLLSSQYPNTLLKTYVTGQPREYATYAYARCIKLTRIFQMGESRQLLSLLKRRSRRKIVCFIKYNLKKNLKIIKATLNLK